MSYDYTVDREARRLKPFKSDGCSGCLMFFIRLYWKWRYGCKPPWEQECEQHDEVYYLGGTARERLRADIVLIDRIAAHGYIFLARLVFIGVSIGGVPWLRLPWRWGFGLPFYQPYKKARKP